MTDSSDFREQEITRLAKRYWETTGINEYQSYLQFMKDHAYDTIEIRQHLIKNHPDKVGE